MSDGGPRATGVRDGGEVEIRPYRPGDEAAINRAFNRTFGGERSLAEWAWKFPAEGGGRDHISVAVNASGDVVAHFAAQPVTVQVDGRALVAGHAVDAFAHPGDGLARRGVYVRTVERLYREHGGRGGLAFLYGFPGRRHLVLGRRLLAYEDPVPVAYFHRRELPPAAAGTASPARRSLRDRLARRAVVAETSAAVDDRLWQRAAGRYRVAAVRDGAHLARRFGGRPGVEYHRRIVWRSGEPRAGAAFRVSGNGLRWADLVWDGTSEGDLRALEAAVCAGARSLAASSGELWLAGDSLAVDVLCRLGWEPTPHPEDLQLTTVSLDAAVDAAALARGLYFTLGDSDLV